jgi:outer membrane receptor for ferrienterochelin and colicins
MPRSRVIAATAAAAFWFCVAPSAVAARTQVLQSAQPVQASRSASITGTVVEARSGAPVAGATVQASAAGRVVASATTGFDGGYRLTGIDAGSYTVVVTRIGFTPGRIPVSVETSRPAAANLTLAAIASTLNPVVTVASRREETSLDAPAAVGVVDAQAIGRRPSATVVDHLQGMAGLDINKGGVAQSNVVSRGFNNAFSGTMLMLQDYRFAGVPSLRVNVPMLFPGTNEDIERIEVLLGPASALYGPNSAAGVLHVITKSPFTSQGTTLTIDGGSRDFVRGSVRNAHAFNDRVALKVSAEMLNASDWKYQDPGEPGTIIRPAAQPSGTRTKDTVANARDFGVRRASGEVRLDLRPTDRAELVTTFGMSRMGNGLELTAASGSAQARNWTYSTIQQRARVGRLFAQAFVNLSDAGNADSNDLSGTFLLRSGQPIVDQSRVYVAQIQHGFRVGGREDLTYGVDYISTNPRTGNTINGRNEESDNVKEIGGYVQSTTTLARKLDFIGTVRVDQNDRLDGSQFSPRAALVFKATPTQNLRATYNRAFNSPSNFSLFLDLIQQRSGPYTVRAVGNPPKAGWSFNRSCAESVSGGLCMKSLFLGSQANTFVSATASSAVPGLIASQSATIRAAFIPDITALLISQGLPPATAAQQAPVVAAQLVTYLGTLRPTAQQVGTRIAKVNQPGTTRLTPSDVADIAPLRPSYNTDYEVGYKGIIGNRLRLAVNAWYERRGDVGIPADVATPSVYADSASLATYLAASLAPAVQQMGISAPAAQAASAAAGQKLAASFQGVPLGIITFADERFATSSDIYATYTTYAKEVPVKGADIAVDFVASDRLDLAATFSWVSDMIFEGTLSSNNLPLMLNAPDRKGSVTARLHDDTRGLSFEARGRFFNAYPVNSGVYATGYTFRTNGQYTYDDVKSARILDANFSWKLPIKGAAQDVTWSLNAENLLGREYRTFPGTPMLGRMLTTRVRYSF